MAEVSKNRRQLLIGKTKKLLDAGYSISEIAKTIGVSEVTVNAYKEIIDEAKANGLK